MPTESIQIDPVGRPQPPPKVAEPLTCPRCESNNTKFCYYNNYNLSQPRHFCKACRRYWTHGGTLRNVPIGGGTRKNSKRSRSYSSSTTTSTTTNSSSSTATNTTTSASHGHQTDQSLPVPAIPEVSTLKSENLSDFLNINNESISLFGQDGSFNSFLSSEHGQGFMGMIGYASGFGYGFCETGRANWAYPAGMRYVKGEAVDGGYAIEGDNSSGCNTWQQVEVGDGLVDGDHGCFSRPGLAISTPGKVFK